MLDYHVYIVDAMGENVRGVQSESVLATVSVRGDDRGRATPAVGPGLGCEGALRDGASMLVL